MITTNNQNGSYGFIKSAPIPSDAPKTPEAARKASSEAIRELMQGDKYFRKALPSMKSDYLGAHNDLNVGNLELASDKIGRLRTILEEHSGGVGILQPVYDKYVKVRMPHLTERLNKLMERAA